MKKSTTSMIPLVFMGALGFGWFLATYFHYSFTDSEVIISWEAATVAVVSYGFVAIYDLLNSKYDSRTN